MPAETKRPASCDAWIDMYGGEDFEQEVKDYIAMVDRACQTIVQSENDEETKNNELLAMYVITSL
jgi:thiaminase